MLGALKYLKILCPSPQAPVSAKKEKKVSCMFIPDGRVSVSARIDRKGFCEGKLQPGVTTAWGPRAVGVEGSWSRGSGSTRYLVDAHTPLRLS